MSTLRLATLAQNYGVGELAKVVLDNPKFPVWSGASTPYKHHYGKGGLAQHTWEVAHLCLLNNDFFGELEKPVDDQALLLAAIFHDAGKMWDYKPLDAEFQHWTGTKHKRQVYHLSRSALVWHDAVKTTGLCGGPDGATHDDVLHAILAHHGLSEWGSPVAPATRLAWLLHLCDALSARMDDCDQESLPV